MTMHAPRTVRIPDFPQGSTTPAQRCLLGAASMLFAVAAFLLGEFLWTRTTGASTVPFDRHQRGLIFLQLTILGGLGLAAAWRLRGRRNVVPSAVFSPESAAAGAWWALGGLAACGGAFHPNFQPMIEIGRAHV